MNFANFLRSAAAAAVFCLASCSPEAARVTLSAGQAKQFEDDRALMQRYLEDTESLRVPDVALAANRFKELGNDLAKASDDASFDEAAKAFAHDSMILSAKSLRASTQEELAALVQEFLPKLDAFQSTWLQTEQGA